MTFAPKPATESLIRQVLDDLDDLLFYERDSTGRFTFVSPSARNILGIAPENALGQSPSALGIRVLQTMPSRVMADSNTRQRGYQAIARHAQGHTVNLEVVETQSTIDGATRTFGCARDITQRTDAERQLRLADEILRNVATMVLVVDSDGLVVFGSPSVTRILGYTQAEITGLGWWTKSLPDSDEQRRAATRAAEIASGVRRPRSEPYELEVIDSQGRQHWILWQECSSANHLAIFCGQDITSRRCAEHELNQRTEELSNSEQELRAIFDSALEGMFILDNSGCVLDVNPSGAGLVRTSRSKVVGNPIEDFARDSSAVKMLLTDLHKKGWTRGELQFAHSNGEIAYTDCTLKANILPGRHLLVMRDQTHRRELEEQLRQAQKMEAIGRLAGGVAHDINNMLTVIHGYCELMLRTPPTGDSLHRHASSIMGAVDRCGLITQQLLAFSRHQVLQPRTLNLNEVVAEMGKLLQKLIGEDLQLCMRLSPDLGDVMADPGQIGQILLNLAGNARDAMPQGGWITIETRNTMLQQRLTTPAFQIEPGEYVTLSIIDNGCGMTPEVQSHIFEPFFTTKELGKGTGLGLSTVYGIVRQNRGALLVLSHPGVGSTFSVYLPRTDQHSAHPRVTNLAIQESLCES
jgi:PAS domain S-box-containing protein